MTTKELCDKFGIELMRTIGAKHYLQLDIKGRPVVAYDRVGDKEEWSDKTAIVQTMYDREVLNNEIKKLEDKEDGNVDKEIP